MKKRIWQRGLLIYSVVVLGFIAFGIWITNGKVIPTICNKLEDKIWWAENILSLILFTVIGGGLVYLVQEYRDKIARESFSDWTLTITGLIDENGEDAYKDKKPESIYWEDVRKFQGSPFEEWKFIKSAVSNICMIKTPDRVDAYEKWYWRNDTEHKFEERHPRSYVIDFSCMEPDCDISEWRSELIPKGFKLVDAPKKKFRIPQKDNG